MRFQFPYWYICEHCHSAGFHADICYMCTFENGDAAYHLEQIEHSINIGVLHYLWSFNRYGCERNQMIHILTSAEHTKFYAWQAYLERNVLLWAYEPGYTILEIADIRTALTQLRIDILNPRFPNNDVNYWRKRMEKIHLFLK